jgi:nitrile hydratase
MTIPERRVNDIGGLEGGPVERHEHAVTLFEKRVDALVMLLVSPGIGAFKVDALRRAVESNSPEDYTSFSYYVKWLNAVRDLLVEQGVIERDELERRIAELAAAEA